MVSMTTTPPFTPVLSTRGCRLIPHRHRHPHPHPHRGFSMVEVLVGVAIGLIGLLVIFKTLSVWDSHTRSTSVGGDAQVAGALAMYALERDIKQAGMGFGTATVADLGCTVDASDTVRGGAFQFSMFPVQIVAGASGAPDTIDVMYGNSSFFAATQRKPSPGPATPRRRWLRAVVSSAAISRSLSAVRPARRLARRSAR